MSSSVDTREGSAAEQAPVDDLGGLDAILAGNAFGNDEYLTEQMHICFRRRLGRIAAKLSAAGGLLDVLDRADSAARYRVLGDMIVRCAVQHASTQLESGQEYGLPLRSCERIFDAARAELQCGRVNTSSPGIAELTRTSPRFSWIDASPPSGGMFEQVFSEAFDFLVEDAYGSDAVPCPIGDDEFSVYEKGLRLLAELLPLCSRSALNHVHLMTFMSPVGDWTGRMSASEYRLSGTVFLNRFVLAHHWRAAEHILHEALHQQLYDFRQAHSLFKENDNGAGMPRIHTPWNVPGNNQFDPFRALAAFHVYTHLSLLSILAQRRADDLRDEFGEQASDARMIAPHTALSRARHLRDQILALLLGELGPAGQHLVQWYSSVLDVLDSSPPPAGSTTHLYLDRYRVEARQVLVLMNEEEDHSALYGALRSLAADEIRTTYRVLEMLGAQEQQVALHRALTEVLGQNDKKMEFGRVRGLISKTLLGVADGYRLAPDMEPDHVVAAMVDESSDRIVALTGSS